MAFSRSGWPLFLVSLNQDVPRTFDVLVAIIRVIIAWPPVVLESQITNSFLMLPTNPRYAGNHHGCQHNVKHPLLQLVRSEAWEPISDFHVFWPCDGER